MYFYVASFVLQKMFGYDDLFSCFDAVTRWLAGCQNTHSHKAHCTAAPRQGRVVVPGQNVEISFANVVSDMFLVCVICVFKICVWFPLRVCVLKAEREREAARRRGL